MVQGPGAPSMPLIDTTRKSPSSVKLTWAGDATKNGGSRVFSCPSDTVESLI